MNKNLGNGIFIPTEILLDSTLSSTSKILMGVILTGTEHNKCLFNNEFLGSFVCLKKISCSNLLKDLKFNKYLEKAPANNFNICNKNAHRHSNYKKNFTGSRNLYLITDNFNEEKLMRNFIKDKLFNEKIVKDLLKIYNSFNFKKTEMTSRDYLLIFRAYKLFGKNKVSEALEIMSKSSFVKENLSIHSIFKASIIRNALGNKIEIYLKKVINFREMFNEEEIDL
ncbi:hypothetical protein [Fusobacterium sp. MFO224]|uniref:hypothetical protein n=1 Tax=Fusobacterium sp. MFO224 TaxID=3378070 RepID=UPI0038540097